MSVFTPPHRERIIARVRMANAIGKAATATLAVAFGLVAAGFCGFDYVASTFGFWVIGVFVYLSGKARTL